MYDLCYKITLVAAELAITFYLICFRCRVKLSALGFLPTYHGLERGGGKERGRPDSVCAHLAMVEAGNFGGL